jgi:hypothetical protein
MVPLRIPVCMSGSSTGIDVASVADARPTRALLDRFGDRFHEVDGRGDTTPQGLRGDEDARTREARALPLDGQVLQVLVAHGLDEEGVPEHAAFDDLRRRLRGAGRAIVGALDNLVFTTNDDEASRHDIERLAAHDAGRDHRNPARGASALCFGNGILLWDALDEGRKSRRPGCLLRSFDLAPRCFLGTASKIGSKSWRSRRASVSDGGRLRLRSASFLKSSMLASRIFTRRARIAATISTKRRAAIFSSSHTRTFSMSGA